MSEETEALRAMANAVQASTQAVQQIMEKLPGMYVSKEVADLRWKMQEEDHGVLQVVYARINQLQGLGIVGPVVSAVLTAVIVYAILHR